MDNEIRSSEDIVREKVASLGDITPEDRLRWKHIPEGEKLAVRYLAEPSGVDLAMEISQYDPAGQKWLIKGIESVLLKNIELPRNDTIRARSERAMAGLGILKQDKHATDRVLGKIRNLFDHYSGPGARQRQQAYEAFKAGFRKQLQQALNQMGVSASIGANVESLPQFREEWRRQEIRLEEEYQRMLDEYRKELSEVK